MHFAPVFLVVSYLLVTVLLYYFGPMDWSYQSEPWLFLFVLTTLISFAIGSLATFRLPTARTSKLKWEWIVLAGGAFSALLLVPSSFFYTGNMPWQVMDALNDQASTYANLADKLAETDGQRALISFARTITYPVVFAALPLGIIKWRRMTAILWLAWITAISSTIMFSILRGTDREVFDLIIVGFAAILITIATELRSTHSSIIKLVLTKRTLLLSVVIVAISATAFVVFAERRLGRTGLDEASLSEEISTEEGWKRKMCIRKTCADPNHPFLSVDDTGLKYGIAMLTGYLTQGYYGLSLVIDEDFQSTFGLGHSKALTRLYERVTGDLSLYKRSYTHRLAEHGWDDSSQWSTIYVWIANDVGFGGTILVFGLIGFAFSLSWRDAYIGGDEAAAIVFCMLFQLLAYVPANNQLAQTYEAYFALGIWILVWLIQKKLSNNSIINNSR